MLSKKVYLICELLMKQRRMPMWIIEAYEVEDALQLSWELSSGDRSVFNIVAGRVLNKICEIFDKEERDLLEEGRKPIYKQGLVDQINHRRVLSVLAKRFKSGDKEAGEILIEQGD